MKHGKAEKVGKKMAPKYPKGKERSSGQVDRGGFAKSKPALVSNPLRSSEDN